MGGAICSNKQGLKKELLTVGVKKGGHIRSYKSFSRCWSSNYDILQDLQRELQKCRENDEKRLDLSSSDVSFFIFLLFILFALSAVKQTFFRFFFLNNG